VKHDRDELCIINERLAAVAVSKFYCFKIIYPTAVAYSMGQIIQPVCV